MWRPSRGWGPFKECPVHYSSPLLSAAAVTFIPCGDRFAPRSLWPIRVSQRSVPVHQVMLSDVYSALCAARQTKRSRSMAFWSSSGSSREVLPRLGGLTADGVVGPATWSTLPDGGPMPTLSLGSGEDVVRSLQTVLTNGAPGQWGTTPPGIDGSFRPHTLASVRAFQSWVGIAVDGVVGDQTWSVSLHAMNATFETAVGLNFVFG